MRVPKYYVKNKALFKSWKQGKVLQTSDGFLVVSQEKLLNKIKSVFKCHDTPVTSL